MQVPFSWLQSYFTQTLDIDLVAHALTVAGIEVEEILGVGIYHQRVVAGKIIKISEDSTHSGVWHIQVDIGEQICAIVSRAQGLAALKPGSGLAIAQAESILLDETVDSFQLKTVSQQTCYGVQVQAVLCSEYELGIGQEREYALVLAENFYPGQALTELFPAQADWQADQVLLLAILANIARCQSIRGVAQEVAALLDLPFIDDYHLPEWPKVANRLQPKIVDDAICTYLGEAYIENIVVSQSPNWLIRRLVLAGVESINNIVDISNYVMLELGQPTHAYDAQQLSSPNLQVRYAKPGESLHTLAQTSEQEAVVLSATTPVIVNDDKVVAVAGVIGGDATAVTENTTAIILEAAHFDLIVIRKAQQAVRTYSEAASRFSRGVDPLLPQLAMRRILFLLQQQSMEIVLSGFGETRITEITSKNIEVTVEEVQKSLGVRLSASQMQALLARVAIVSEVINQGHAIVAQITSARQDLLDSCDLLEELARLYGYDRLPMTMPSQAIPMYHGDGKRLLLNKIQDLLVRLDLQEVLNYHMTSPELERKLTFDEQFTPEYVSLLNPISEERTVLRRSLMPGVLQNIAYNLRYQDSVAIFECGEVFLAEQPGTHELLPQESLRLCVALTGPIQAESLHQTKVRDFDFFDIKNIAEQLLSHLHIEDYHLQAQSAAPWQPGQSADLLIGQQKIGYLGKLHPQIAENFDLSGKAVYLLDINLALLFTLADTNFQFVAPLKFPSISLDISLIVGEEVSAGQLSQEISHIIGKLLVDIEVFDVYRSAQLGELKKAVALRFTLNGKDRTLTMDEAVALRERIVATLEEKLGATLRA